MSEEIYWCTDCLNTSTRPRIEFDEHGKCNAYTWAEEKRLLIGIREKKVI